MSGAHCHGTSQAGTGARIQSRLLDTRDSMTRAPWPLTGSGPEPVAARRCFRRQIRGSDSESGSLSIGQSS